MPDYWHMKPPKLSRSIPSGLTLDGHPWLGASKPEIEIEMFSDYQCFQCKKMHMYLRQLLERYPQKLRIVHRHYPMDQEVNPIVKTPFHRGSGKMALLAIYAAENGKFWAMNDILFQLAGRDKTIDLKYLAQQTGLDAIKLYKAINDPRIRRKLNRDLKDGINYGIDGTPSFVIGGQVHTGTIPPEIINRILKSQPPADRRG
jgi:protein-disulfide isomerase